jgi:hypothetical protein
MTQTVPAAMLDPDVAIQAELDAEVTARINADAAEVVARNAAIAAAVTLGTAQATTSGTSKDFTGIPATAKRITIMFNGVSLSGTASLLVQLGTSGGVVASGYNAIGMRINMTSTTSGTASTAGFPINNQVATEIVSGHMLLTHMGGNVWVSSHAGKISTILAAHGGGDVTLGAVLDRVRITTTNGTDTFDAGSVNILYE